MAKCLGVTQVRQNLAEIIDDVRTKGDTYVVLRHREPVAAVVPLTVYEQWRASRAALFDTIREIQSYHPDADPDEVLREVIRAQRELRAPGEEAAS